jgi:hypothetical protein
MNTIIPLFSKNSIDGIALAGAFGMYLLLVLALICWGVAVRMFLSLPRSRK